MSKRNSKPNAIPQRDNPYRPGYASTWAGKYGSELSIETRKFGMFTQKSSIQWSAKTKANQTQRNVDRFIDKKWEAIRQQKYFRNALADRLVRGKQEVKDYGLSLIANHMPWVFSSDFLFDPLRQILFCIKTGRDPKYHVQVFKNVSPSVLNQVVQQAIFQSVKYQSNYLQKALLYFKNNEIGIIQRIKNVADQLGTKLLLGVKKIANFVTDLAKTVVTGIANKLRPIVDFALFVKDAFSRKVRGTQLKADSQATLQLNPQKKLQSQFKMSMVFLVQYIFQDLRCYGNIVINFKYLMNIGLKKMVNGLPYYYTYDNPNLFVTCKQSFPSVYLKSQKGILQKIPQSIFNIQYLRGIVTQRLLQQGGSIFKQYVRQTIPAKLTTGQQNKFYKQYLSSTHKQQQNQANMLNQYFTDFDKTFGEDKPNEIQDAQFKSMQGQAPNKGKHNPLQLDFDQ